MQLTQEQVLTNLKNNYDECSLASCSFWVNSFWTEETVAELQVAGKVLWTLTKTFLLVALTLLTALLYYPTLGAIKVWNLLTQAANPISTILNVLEVSSDEFTQTEYTFDSRVAEEAQTQQQDLPEAAIDTISELIKTGVVESNNPADTGESSV